MTETVDALARRYATEGAVVFFPGANTTRATLDLGTSGDRMGYAVFGKLAAYAAEWNVEKFADGSLFCVMTPWQFQDLALEASSPILLSEGYTERGKATLFRNEIGMLYGIRILASRLAKSFYGAGAANASAVSTTLSAAVAAGAKTMTVASATNIVAGMWLHIGTIQTSTESDDTLITEPVRVTGVSGTTITFVGRHELGGCRFAHASGAVVANADTVHAATFGGKSSLAKVFHKEYGEFGKPVFDKVDGMAEQWRSWAFKWLGGFNRLSEGRLIRVETSSSFI